MKNLTFLLLVLGSLTAMAQTAFPNTHAHNDYEQDRPLLEALENGFISVEADVHASNGKLYVVHDRPKDWSKVPTLEDLYLRPLLEQIESNEGKVYADYEGFFYLMIDIKTDSNVTYSLLRQVLKKYQSMISVVEQGEDQMEKPVKVFLSGNRPIKRLLEDDAQYAGLDGRPADLQEDYPVALMPVISDNYRNFLTDRDPQGIDQKELNKLIEVIEETHAQGKLFRLWAIPDRPDMWEYLLSVGVDLINTDRIAELRSFLAEKDR